LFGFVTNTTRVFGVIARAPRPAGKAKSSCGITCTSRPPGDRGVEAEISKAGSGNDRVELRSADRRAQIRDRQRHDPSSRPLTSVICSIGTLR
jgi:hypothetical protein